MQVGIWQLVLILAVVLIVFGAGRLPQVMGDVAKGMKSFKNGLAGDDEAESEDSEPKRIAAKPKAKKTAGKTSAKKKA